MAALRPGASTRRPEGGGRRGAPPGADADAGAGRYRGLYALADRDDDWHERAVEYLEGTNEMLLVPVTVIPEVRHLLKARLGDRAERRFAAALAAGELGVEPLVAADLTRCDEVLNGHPALWFVVASVVAMAERLRVKTLPTADRRHFGQVRPAHTERFTLVP